MISRTTATIALISGLTILSGCGGGGDDWFAQQNAAAGGGGSSLDIAGTYSVVPDTFGFNTLTIAQSGNSLTAFDNGGGTWSGNLSNIIIEETAGADGGLVIFWRGDVSLNGKNAVGDDLSLAGVVDITPSGQVNVTTITAEYQNTDIGLTGQLIMTQTSTIPGGGQQPGGGTTDGTGGGSGAGNK